jgi:hypothetical protein
MVESMNFNLSSCDGHKYKIEKTFVAVRSLMYSSSICSSVPSILRNSRYRRDQRQLEEEEEMWFNEDDDFDDGETVVSAANDILGKKLDSDIDSIGMSAHQRI